MTRLYNFSPGPAALPTAVLEQAQKDILSYQGKGLSVMEMNHRSKDFVAIAEQAEQDLRDLMNIPDNYKRYLKNGLREEFDFSNTPIHLIFRTGKDLEIKEKRI